MFAIPFGRLDPAPAWAPSRVTLIGDAAHAMLPTLGMGANLSLRDAGVLCDAARGAPAARWSRRSARTRQRDARAVYPFLRMAAEHDQHFGGGGLRAGAAGDARECCSDSACGQPDGSAEILLKAALIEAEGGASVELVRLEELHLPWAGPRARRRVVVLGAAGRVRRADRQHADHLAHRHRAG